MAKKKNIYGGKKKEEERKKRDREITNKKKGSKGEGERKERYGIIDGRMDEWKERWKSTLGRGEGELSNGGLYIAR